MSSYKYDSLRPDGALVSIPYYVLDLALEGAEHRGYTKASSEVEYNKRLVEEYKQEVNSLRAENNQVHAKLNELYNKQQPVVVLTQELSDKLRAQPIKIHAIKLLRNEIRPDLGLKDAKQIVDQLWTPMDQEHADALREHAIKTGASCPHGVKLYNFCYQCDKTNTFTNTF